GPRTGAEAMTRSRLRMTLVILLASGLLPGMLLVHHWWISRTIARRDEAAQAGFADPASFADRWDDILVSMQVDDLFVQHWPWLVPVSVALGAGAAVAFSRLRARLSPRWRVRTAMMAIALLAVAMGA